MLMISMKQLGDEFGEQQDHFRGSAIMLIANVWETGELLGAIRFQDGKLGSDVRGSVLFDNMLSTPMSLLIDGEWKTVSPKDDPEVFIRNLYRHYRSVYLCVGEAVEQEEPEQ